MYEARGEDQAMYLRMRRTDSRVYRKYHVNLNPSTSTQSRSLHTDSRKKRRRNMRMWMKVIKRGDCSFIIVG